MSTLYPWGFLHLLDEGAKRRAVDLSDHFLQIHVTIQENHCAMVRSTENPPDQWFTATLSRSHFSLAVHQTCTWSTHFPNSKANSSVHITLAHSLIVQCL
ncbi:hypothetical protein O181_042773 [Austropuccinia psidii MF-1]|uniref:Uncharacterized protein n=1 Tax=Austropuccinia psidii MF-1 TaxID=1389203 RepID=A0A9Q3DK13_9BASI|nr:hypothetical protein [Austropuccinia psidii MF-1]